MELLNGRKFYNTFFINSKFRKKIKRPKRFFFSATFFQKLKKKLMHSLLKEVVDRIILGFLIFILYNLIIYTSNCPRNQGFPRRVTVLS